MAQDTKRRRKIAENYKCLSRVHERYRRQTDDRQTDRRQQIVNVSSRSQKNKLFISRKAMRRGLTLTAIDIDAFSQRSLYAVARPSVYRLSSV